MQERRTAFEASVSGGRASIGILAPLRADADRRHAANFTTVVVGPDLGLLARDPAPLIASFKR